MMGFNALTYVAALERDGAWETTVTKAEKKTRISSRKRYDYPLAQTRGVAAGSI